MSTLGSRKRKPGPLSMAMEVCLALGMQAENGSRKRTRNHADADGDTFQGQCASCSLFQMCTTTTQSPHDALIEALNAQCAPLLMLDVPFAEHSSEGSAAAAAAPDSPDSVCDVDNSSAAADTGSPCTSSSPSSLFESLSLASEERPKPRDCAVAEIAPADMRVVDGLINTLLDDSDDEADVDMATTPVCSHAEQQSDSEEEIIEEIEIFV